MNIDGTYANNRKALDHLRRAGLGWETKESNTIVGLALYESQQALDELTRLRQAAQLVIAQFAEIGDASWPTRGMKTAIDRLEEYCYGGMVE